MQSIFVIVIRAFLIINGCYFLACWAGGVSGNIFWGSVGVEEAWQIKVNLDIFLKIKMEVLNFIELFKPHSTKKGMIW